MEGKPIEHAIQMPQMYFIYYVSNLSYTEPRLSIIAETERKKHQHLKESDKLCEQEVIQNYCL